MSALSLILSTPLNSKYTNEQTIQQTRCWLKNIIIGLNFCPFANREFEADSIRYAVSDSSDLASSLQDLAQEFQYLDQHPNTETTLLIFNRSLQDFDDFVELIDYANQLLNELNYCSTYQLAHFHPQYCFEGEPARDASNYTNRSPFPTLHIIREKSMQHAIENHADTSSIPDTNIKLARKLGVDKIQDMLNSCRRSDD